MYGYEIMGDFPSGFRENLGRKNDSSFQIWNEPYGSCQQLSFPCEVTRCIKRKKKLQKI